MSTTRSVTASRTPRARGPALLHAVGLARDPIGYLRRLQTRSGDPFCVRLPSVGDIYFTGHPEAAEQVFKASREAFEPPEFNPIAPILGDHSLIVLKGERHRKERKLMMPCFAGERMRAYSHAIVAASLSEVSPLRPGDEVSAFELSQSIMLQVIFQGIFGIEDAARCAEFSACVRRLLASYTTPLAALPILRKEFGGFGPWATFIRHRDEFDGLLLEELRARRRAGTSERQDILSLLMDARYEDGSMLTDLELTEEVRTLLVGGHDTSSNTLAWAFYLVLSSPSVLQRIRAEVASLSDAPAPGQLAALPFLGAVSDEVLRLYPPVPFVFRRVLQPCTLRGLELRPGDTVALAMVLLHRAPQLWARPDAFDPDRFLSKKVSPYEYAPYGGGVRRCIGAAFAGHALRVILGTLLVKWDWTLARPTPVTAVGHSISIGPDRPIPLRFQGRSATHLTAIAAKVAHAGSPEQS